MNSTEIGLIILIGGCVVAIAWCRGVKYWDTMASKPSDTSCKSQHTQEETE